MELAKKLLDICKSKCINEELKKSDSWQVLYHLSPVRTNILEWFSFDKNAKLLEVGAEAGAMTGFFAQQVKNVIGLEKDNELLAVNELRNKGYKNIELRNGMLDKIENGECFDYITLIGTLEQASDYVVSDAPCEDMLKQCREHIKENGTLILAIDNRMGMKYWSGAPEHISGKPFIGINNNFDLAQNYLFSKEELKCILLKSGWEEIEFYYPVPDYRFPTTIYSDDFLPQRGELRSENAVYEEGGYQFFKESLAYDTICQDGKFSYFADSFLILARASAKLV